jgi:ribosome-binding protein aMBF1 (putative translation factor)
MSRRRRTSEPKHVRLYGYMLKTDAWRSLSCQARCLLIELQGLYNGNNNGLLFMSVRQAAELLRTGTKQARAAQNELEDRGFIRAKEKGWFGSRDRIATRWLLTEHKDDTTGREATKDFIRWRATVQPHRVQTPVVAEKTDSGRRDHRRGTKTTLSAPDGGRREHPKADSSARPVVSETTQLVNHPVTASSEGDPTRAGDPGARLRSQKPAVTNDDPEGIAQHIAARVRSQRRALRWTQRRLAEVAGTHQPIVSQIERGALARVGPETIARVARAVGVEVGVGQ